MGVGRERKLPSHPRHQGEQQHQPQGVDGERPVSDSAAEYTTGYGRGIEGRGEHTQSSQQLRRRQA